MQYSVEYVPVRHNVDAGPLSSFGLDPQSSMKVLVAACSGDPTSTGDGLIRVIENLHQLGVRLAIPLAGLLYLISGLYWMRGTTQAQDFAKRLFISTTVGLVIVLVSGGLAEIVTGPLC